MTQELKNALITIAEYDGWIVKGDTISTHRGWARPFDFWLSRKCRYHYSADALLPVWIKVREAIRPKVKSEQIGNTNISGLNYWFRDIMKVNSSGQDILSGDYEPACIKLAQIIKQLK